MGIAAPAPTGESEEHWKDWCLQEVSIITKPSSQGYQKSAGIRHQTVAEGMYTIIIR